jgi:hypothetical protein
MGNEIFFYQVSAFEQVRGGVLASIFQESLFAFNM